jgi:hypothetical protein
MIEKIKPLIKLFCILGIHYREYNGQRGFQQLGVCIACGQKIVVRRADLEQNVTSYPLPNDCEKLISATVDGYNGTYTVNEYAGELLVSPAPLRTHVRGLKVVYVYKPTME